MTREELLRNLRAASADVAAWPPWKMSPDVAAEIAALENLNARLMDVMRLNPGLLLKLGGST